jgi:hypothetical protein
LSGEGEESSKIMILNAIQKHYPELFPKYQKWFPNSFQLPEYYRDVFYEKMEEICTQYDLKNRII